MEDNNKQLPKISVITVVLNNKSTIEETIKSVLNQKYPNLEYIIIDGGSTDGTLDIINKYNEQIDYLKSEKDLGIYDAFNKGLKIASGEWIQFLDADDLLFPDKIANQINFLNNIKCDIIFSPMKHVKLNGTSYIKIPEEDVLLGLLKSNLGCTCSNLFKKEILNKINGWDESLMSSQEYDLMFRLYKINSNFIYYNKCETIIRERKNGQISKSNTSERITTYFELRNKMYSYFSLNKLINNKLKEEFYWIIYYYGLCNKESSILLYEKFLKNYKPKSYEKGRLQFTFHRLIGFSNSIILSRFFYAKNFVKCF